MPRTEEMEARYGNHDGDLRGPWTSGDLSARNYYSEGTYPITCPSGRVIEGPPPGTYWRVSKNKFVELDNDKRIWWGKDGNNAPRLKRFLSEVKQGRVPQTLWFYDEVGHTQDAKKEINDLFTESAVFETPKPSRLIKRIAQISTETNDTILDFFAGSGTTAHAVMALNTQDNGKRKFILVQIPEVCDKKSKAYQAGYHNIFEITKARIEKAAAKIKADNPIFHGDLGFKVFATVPVPDGYGEELEALASPNSDLFDGSLMDEQQLNDLLTTWKVYDGIALTAPLLPVDLAGYTGWQQQNILYLLHKNFSTSALTALLQKLDDTEDKAFNLERLVLFAHNFDSKHQREISEAMKQYQNRKQKSVSVELRY